MSCLQSYFHCDWTPGWRIFLRNSLELGAWNSWPSQLACDGWSCGDSSSDGTTPAFPYSCIPLPSFLPSILYCTSAYILTARDTTQRQRWFFKRECVLLLSLCLLTLYYISECPHQHQNLHLYQKSATNRTWCVSNSAKRSLSHALVCHRFRVELDLSKSVCSRSKHVWRWRAKWRTCPSEFWLPFTGHHLSSNVILKLSPAVSTQSVVLPPENRGVNCMFFPYLHPSLLFLCQAKPVFTVNAHYQDGLNTGTFIATRSILPPQWQHREGSIIRPGSGPHASGLHECFMPCLKRCVMLLQSSRQVWTGKACRCTYLA